jgi:outer membrane receptor for ferrienterochelin and colicins
MRLVSWMCFVLAVGASPARAQTAAAVLVVETRTAERPLPGVAVAVNGTVHRTNDVGTVSVSVPPGRVQIVARPDGFVAAETVVELRSGEQRTIVLELHPQPTVEEEITVAATRTNKRIEDVPMRVEVLEREEIEEKMLMTPGDIVMMLNEMGGMRVQATSPSLGAASVRIQGMRGRYTRFLSDGLPLFGEQVGSLGLLQIPPVDLGQVEVIKGVASALYGAGAMGGVVNLVSRRPGKSREREVLVNQSSRGATDAVFWYSAPVSTRWGVTFLASGNGQRQTDVNDDGWADLPGYLRAVIRPRVFWDAGDGRTFFATFGTTIEDRNGGTMSDEVLAATGAPFAEALRTRRVDGGAAGQILLRGKYVLTARAAVAQQRHRHQFGDALERDRHDTVFSEAAIRGTAPRQTWVVGAAIEYDGYINHDLPRFDHAFTIPGVFVQDDVEVTPWLALTASARLDHHNVFGTFLSPRVGGLLRGGGWTSRVSLGTGFFGPSVLTEETEAAGLGPVTVPRPLTAERGRSASIDVSRTIGPGTYSLTVFHSRVTHPIDADRSAGLVLTNAGEPAANNGVDLVATLRHAPFALTATYTYVRSREAEGDGRADAVLTPRHGAGIVGMWERAGTGRLGIEWYYTGTQRLEENPFRQTGKPYMIVGALAERQFGRLRLFVNGENLSGVRQTRFDPLIRPTRGADGRWTVDAWAPLEGRNINGGLRVHF